MKFYQKLITLIVVLSLALATIGIIAGVQVINESMAAQTSSAAVEMSTVIAHPGDDFPGRGPSLAPSPPVPAFYRVSWNG